MQNLVAAAHAAGYAMAPSDEVLGEALEVMPRRFPEEFVDEAEVEAFAPAPPTTALVVRWQDPYKTSWIREWIASWRFGRATA
jgi:hypothetical protein